MHSINAATLFAVHHGTMCVLGKHLMLSLHIALAIFLYLVLNPNGYQCTNSIHRVYFKSHVNQAMKEWLQISLLSLPCIVQMESLARHYGRSVLKLEPSACSKILVRTLNRSIARKEYFKISEYASKGNRLEAVRLATILVSKRFGLPLELLKRSEKTLNQFRGASWA